LQIIPLDKVNSHQWDAVVSANDNGLIYSSYSYLQAVCTHCLAVIINDYEAVMALPFKKKWGIPYLYTPPFVQQLGLIGNISPDYYAPIIQQVQQQCRYGDMLFNFQNTFIEKEAGSSLKNNFIIDLRDDYQRIKSHYHSSVSYSLHKAAKAGCTYISSDNAEEAIGLYQAYNKENLNHVTNKDFHHLIEWCKVLSLQDKLLIRKIINHRNELLSIVLLLKDNKRYYNLINIPHHQADKRKLIISCTIVY